MIDKTFEDLIVEVQKGIYQVAGIGTQVYSQDLIGTKITDAFWLLAQDPDKEWKRFNKFTLFTLDGVSGRTTIPVNTEFANFDAITRVFAGTSNKPLVYANLSMNPLSITGDTPLKYIPDNLDIIRILPITATGDITVVGKAFPTEPFELDTIIPFDYLCLKWKVVWEYMIEDGTNPGASELARQQFQARYEAIHKNQQQEPIAIDGVGGLDIPTQWWAN